MLLFCILCFWHRGMWDLSFLTGVWTHSLAVEAESFLTAGSPGKSLDSAFIKHYLMSFCLSLTKFSPCLNLHEIMIFQKQSSVQFNSVQLLSHVQLFATLWTAACQASLSFTISWSFLKLMSIGSMMSSNHLVLFCSLLLLPSIFPSIKVFSNESALHIRWPKHWSFSLSISPSNEYSGLISFSIGWFDLLAVQETLKSFL